MSVQLIDDTDLAEVARVQAQLQRRGLTPAAVLGLPSEPSKAAVVAAFQRLVVQLRPARYASGSRVRAAATQALHDIRAAYDQLVTGAAETVISQPRLAQGSTPELRPIGAMSVAGGATAEELLVLRTALAHIRERAWAAAAAVLEPVVATQAASARCIAYLYLVQGHLADEDGRIELAVVAWRNALACDATLSAARTALAMHAARTGT